MERTAIGQATFLKPGLTWEGRELNPGGALNFWGAVVFSSTEGSLRVSPLSTQNGLRVYHRSRVEQVRSPFAFAGPTEVTGLTTLGEDPSKPPKETFGDPEPTLEVAFLGHPHRVHLAPLLETQITDYQSDRVLEHSDTLSGVDRKILLAGKPFRSSFLSPETLKPFRGQGMLMGEFFSNSQDRLDHLRVGMVTVADSDSLMRIHYGSPVRLFLMEGKQRDEAIRRFAEISVFAQDPIGWVGAKPDETFPMIMATLLNRYLMDSNWTEPIVYEERNRNEGAFVGRLGSIWKETKANLAGHVASEKDRLEALFAKYSQKINYGRVVAKSD